MKQKNGIIDKQTLNDIGYELWKSRKEKRLYIYQIEKKTAIPAKVIDGMESGRFIQFKWLRKLLSFYNKQLRISCENIKSDL